MIILTGTSTGDKTWLLHQRTGWNWAKLHRSPRHDH